MRNFTRKVTFLSAFVLLLFGCSIDDHLDKELKNEKMGSISFSGILKELTENNKLALKEIDAAIPGCKDNKTPEYVRIALRNNDAGTNEDEIVWVQDNDEDADFFIDIPVVPISSDNDDDGATNYLTMESSELELVAGNYSLEYFAVLNSEKETIMVTPREDQDYGPAMFQNFVDRALPIPIKIQAGTKHYTQLETLCYDVHFAEAYGYLFFDFEEVNLTNLCVFGNVCDDNITHSPAHFRLKVWEYDISTEDKGEKLVNWTNMVNFSSTDPNKQYAQALCVPLPDRQGIDYYYAEVLLINEGSETLIRKGAFTDTELKTFYDETEDAWHAYHFRESCCGEEDETDLLEDINDDPTEQDCAPAEDPGPDPDCGECKGKLTTLTFRYIGPYGANSGVKIEVKQNTPENKRILVYSGFIGHEDVFTIQGEFRQNNNPPSLWTEIYIEVEGEETVQIPISCSEEIGTGAYFGYFKIIAGESMNGGILCPVDIND